jgi:hypothetical protein
MADQSRSQHVLDLARELLDDIELSRVSAEALVLKGTRLARWVDNEEVRGWLKFEMRGYNNTEPLSLTYMGRTGRWTNRDKKEGMWAPLAQIEAHITSSTAKLSVLRIPDSSSDYANIAITNVANAMTDTANFIARVTGVKSRVIGLLHTFVSDVYYAKAFESLAESIFERYKQDVDALVTLHCSEVLEKMPAVMDRLADGDAEAISQALMSCRRIIESFADAIFPPSDGTTELGGNTVRLDASRHQNRINAFVHEKTSSHSRRQRLRQNLANLFDRASSGVHEDVTAEEARALFLNTYLFLGEVLHLGKP